MQAAVLTEPGTVELRERERPAPVEGEVLVRVREVGICGSDLHYYEHGGVGDGGLDGPHVLGHESAGEVAALGDGVTGLSVGDRVTVEPGAPCRRCEHCRRGAYNRCPDVTFLGSPPDDGALREYIAWPADCVYPLPEGVSTREGALCEPLSVGVHAARRAGVSPGDTVLVTGAGPIGRCACEAVRAAGATDVVVSDVVPAKLDRARDRGADRTVDVCEADLTAAVGEYADGRGVDCAIEASGASAAVRSAVEAIRRGGAVALVGMAADPEVSLDTLDLINREVDLRGCYRYADTYPTAIALLSDGRADLTRLVDFEAPLSAVDDALQRAGEPETVKGTVTL